MHRDVKALAQLAGFGVDVVEHSQVVRYESDRQYNNVAKWTLAVKFLDAITDIGFKPRLLRRATAALVDEFPEIVPYATGN
jgi:hypothetical protein